MTNAQKNLEISLLTEHFRYTPLSLLDAIINTVNELVNRAVDAAEQGLLAVDPVALGFVDDVDDVSGEVILPAEIHREVEDGVHQLETLLDSNLDRNFDKFEIYILRNVLTIPADLIPWIRLQHYDYLDFHTPPDPVNPAESLHATLRKYRATKKLNVAIKASIARNDKLIDQFNQLLDMLSRSSSLIVHDSQSTEIPGKIFHHLETLITHLPRLHQLLEALQPAFKDPVFTKPSSLLPDTLLNKISSLPPFTHPESDPNAVRRAYIESRLQKVLPAKSPSNYTFIPGKFVFQPTNTATATIITSPNTTANTNSACPHSHFPLSSANVNQHTANPNEHKPTPCEVPSAPQSHSSPPSSTATASTT